MASILKPPPFFYRNSIPVSSSSSSLMTLSSPFNRTTSLQVRFCALRTGPDRGRIGSQESYAEADLFKKPSSLSGKESDGYSEEGELVDWEDRILQETVPLVGFVRMILHSGRYESGDRLSSEHEKTILERLLPYHPECEKKIGCGIDHITVNYHPEFEDSRCLFIVRKDGELVDFSYRKCIKGLIRKKYPLYADSFIFRHFRRRRRRR